MYFFFQQKRYHDNDAQRLSTNKDTILKNRLVVQELDTFALTGFCYRKLGLHRSYSLALDCQSHIYGIRHQASSVYSLQNLDLLALYLNYLITTMTQNYDSYRYCLIKFYPTQYVLLYQIGADVRTWPRKHKGQSPRMHQLHKKSVDEALFDHQQGC